MIRLCALPWLLFSLFAASPAAAQSSVVIWPVDPSIAPGQQATALWLENRGAEPVTLQVRSFAWSQAAGEDSYAEQDTVISSPPIAEIAPGQRQLVRVIRRAPDPAGEHAYRLLVDELPRPKAGPDAGLSAQLAVQMRYSIPLFTYGTAPGAVAPALTARVELAAGKRWLVVSNSGSGHARLTDLRLGNGVVKSGLLGTVLAGATMRWELPEQTSADPTFTVAVNGSDQTLGRAS